MGSYVGIQTFTCGQMVGNTWNHGRIKLQLTKGKPGYAWLSFLVVSIVFLLVAPESIRFTLKSSEIPAMFDSQRAAQTSCCHSHLRFARSRWLSLARSPCHLETAWNGNGPLKNQLIPNLIQSISINLQKMSRV